MANVELHVYPPLSYKMSSKKVGAHSLEVKINEGETLGDLLARLANANHEAWQQVFDTRTDSIRPFGMTIFNGTVLPFPEGGEWVFYGDRLQSRGSLGLLVNPRERPRGQVQLSNYGVVTLLGYPGDTRHLHLAFFAYSIENEPAERAFLAGLDREQIALRTIPFWTETDVAEE